MSAYAWGTHTKVTPLLPVEQPRSACGGGGGRNRNNPHRHHRRNSSSVVVDWQENSGNSCSSWCSWLCCNALNFDWIEEAVEEAMADARTTDEQHEAFKNRLVEEVLGQDASSNVPMEKVVMLIWQFRDDPSVVTYMARFVAKYSRSRTVFDGIEFYLPQLAHMILQLEVDWDDAILERFVLVIAQQSMHFALQFNWILQGAKEDYHPELMDGTPNPLYNPQVYSRCLKLLKNVERCVVYGKPRAAELQRLYEKGKISQEEMMQLEQADRRFNALQITADVDMHAEAPTLDGWVYVQLPTPRSSDGEGRPQGPSQPQSEAVSRFCSLGQSVINIAKQKGGCDSGLQLERAFSLEEATVESEPNNKIRVSTPLNIFVLCFSVAEERNLWYRRLTEESEQLSGHSMHGNTTPGWVQDLTPDQLVRYEFFQNERIFVKSLTDIAEELRFVDRSERKALAPGKMKDLKIPPVVYLPLCNTSDIWRRVGKVIANATRVFNTKERCPVVMNFLSKRGEPIKGDTATDPNLDVAEFMLSYLETSGGEPDTIDEGDENDEANDGDEEEENEKPMETIPLDGGSAAVDPVFSSEGKSSSRVWQDEEHGGQPAHKVQRLLRDSVVLPLKLAKRLGGPAQRSIMDLQTQMQPAVPIVGESRAKDEHVSVGGGRVLNVQQSSIRFKDQIVLGDMHEGDIDIESINRAKKFVSGGESWAEKSARLLEEAVKDEPAMDQVQMEVSACLAKSNDDLRQEVFVMQMIHFYKSVFAKAKLPLWLKTYRILSTSSSTGLLEYLTDATSLDGLKKAEGYPKETGLRGYFELVYGGPSSKAFKEAQKNFVQSLAAYGIVSYLLGLKDRHNGNIMIDTRGHLIFIDFGFAMGMAPGHEFSMERAPFKLTKEFIEVMGGLGSEPYKEFERLFVAGLSEARRNSQIALGLVEIMMYKSNYPCFSGWRYGNGIALRRFEKRLLLHVPDNMVEKKARQLVRRSRQHLGTYLYDVFQKATNGYEI